MNYTNNIFYNDGICPKCNKPACRIGSTETRTIECVNGQLVTTAEQRWVCVECLKEILLKSQ